MAQRDLAHGRGAVSTLQRAPLPDTTGTSERLHQKIAAGLRHAELSPSRGQLSAAQHQVGACLKISFLCLIFRAIKMGLRVGSGSTSAHPQPSPEGA